MNTVLTKEQLEKSKLEIKKYNLVHNKRFFECSDKFIINCFNGAGADGTNIIARICITEILSMFITAILLHDFSFTLKDEEFDIVNQDFRENMEKLLDAKSSNIFSKSWNRFLKIAAFDMVNKFGNKWELI